jgi:hypothetical protein
MTLRRAVAAGLASLAAAAPPAAAQEITRGELRDLAARAQSDPGALEELRRVERVDGAPADLAQALGGAEGEALERRLGTLAESAGGPAATPPPRAREEAQDILSERRFHGTDVPRPFRRPLEWLGGRLRALGESVPGGPAALWVILGALVVGLAALVAGRVARRRAADAVERGRAATAAGQTDVRRLEQEAAEAERRGELERALRLLFRAGLLRLDRARAIVLRDSLTTGQVRRELRSREFDGVARVFDEVTYGRRPPEPADVEASRRGWRRVLEKAGAR